MSDKPIPPERALTRTPAKAPPTGGSPTPTHRQRSFAYFDESMAMPQQPEEPDVPQEPMPLRTREASLSFGQYRGVPLSQVPTEHLLWQRDAFENGADADVMAELRRRGEA